MHALFLVEYVAFQELKGVYKDLLQVDMLIDILLVSHLLEGNCLMSERAQASLLTQTVFDVLGNELSLASQLKYRSILMQDDLCLLAFHPNETCRRKGRPPEDRVGRLVV